MASIALPINFGRSKWVLFAGLVVLVVLYACELGILARTRGTASWTIIGLWQISFRLFIVFWLRADRQVRGLSVPYEFDAFAFWAYPFAILYQMWTTRRWRGVAIGLGMLFLLAVPYI